MLDRNRQERFALTDFLREPRHFEDFAEAQRIQRAGLLLTEMREKAQLSVEQLAEKLHRNPEEVLRIERGQLLKSPAMSLMLQILEICHQEIRVNTIA